MIKILFFIEKLGGGGAEKVLRDLVNHMDQSKFDITVQSVWPYKEGKLLVPGIKYKSVYSVRNSITKKLYRAEAASRMLYRLHVKDSYDIECAFLEAGSTKVIASSTNRTAKKIAWVHCDLQKLAREPSKYVRKTIRWYRKFDAIACVSNNVKESFDKMYGREFPTSVIYNVVDAENIERRSKEELPPDIHKNKFTIVSIGRLSYEKGYDMLLRIHKRLINDGYPVDLWIVGEGEDRNLLEAIIIDEKLESSVKLLGFRDNPYSMIRSADLLVCSSRWEGFSTFATEGIILGKPLVTTDCAGMRELLGDSKYGLVTDCDEQSLYEGVVSMIDDSKQRERYTEAARKRGKEFSSEDLTRKVEEFLMYGVTP